MDPTSSIGKLGFRRWYQRQLVEAHAWLVAWLLTFIGALGAYEVWSTTRPPLEQALLLGSMFVGGLISVHALRRYITLFRQATHYSQRATCAGCASFGMFDIVEASPARMRVRCRGCGHEWQI